MKSKLINNLFGDKLLDAMRELLNEFITLEYDEKMIYKALKYVNESVRIGLYLMALERDLANLAYKINRVNKKLNELRKEKFIESYNNKETEKYLALLGKGDKISLMSDLGVDLPLKERTKLSEVELDYYRLISNSVMLDQEYDKRNGIDTFVTYKKDDKKA